MLRRGRILVALVGVAALLFSAFATLYTVAMSGENVGLSAILTVAGLVGTVAIMRVSAWGAVVIAGWTALFLVYLLQNSYATHPVTFLSGRATVLAITVAIGLARDKARRGELTWRG